jgi:tetratricopeptide (TPR) repeat protein
MKHFRHLTALALVLAGPAALADTMRPEVGKPLQAAETALASHRYSAALEDVARAEQAPGLTGAETTTIREVRAEIEAKSGNNAAAAADYAALAAGGGGTQMAQAAASFYYQAGDYAKTIQTIKAYLPSDPQFHALLLQSYYQTGDCAALSGAIAPALKERHPPAEQTLNMAAYCYGSQKQMDGYKAIMTDLVTYYPNPTYWSDLLGQLQATPAFQDRLSIDFLRLQLAVGMAVPADIYMEQTQVAVQLGLYTEASKIINQGFATGVLGTSGDVDREKRLQALVATKLAAATPAAEAAAAQQAIGAKDFPTLLNIGLNDVDAGNASVGIPLMEQAIRSGGLTQTDQAELEMGVAYNEAGNRSNALAMWHAVGGGDGAQTLAQLWPDVR